MSKQSAIFPDRDGTIIENIGYINKPEDVIFSPDSFSALKIKAENFLLLLPINPEYQKGLQQKPK